MPPIMFYVLVTATTPSANHHAVFCKSQQRLGKNGLRIKLFHWLLKGAMPSCGVERTVVSGFFLMTAQKQEI